VTKDEQITIVASKARINAREARAALDAVSAMITAGLVADGKITVHGLGTFQTRLRSPRRVFNPATKVMMDAPAKTVVRFKPSGYLRERVEATG